MKTGSTRGHALVEHGKQAIAATARLAEGIEVKSGRDTGYAAPYAPEFVDPPKSSTGSTAWIKALRSLRPCFTPSRGALVETADKVTAMNEGIARFEAGKRSDPRVLSDPFQYSLVMMRSLEQSRKALRGTTGEGIITTAYIQQLHDHLRPQAKEYLSRALSWVDREDALSRLLAEHRATGLEPDGSLSVDRVLGRAAEAYERALAAPTAMRFGKLTELHSRLLDVFCHGNHPKVFNSLSPEARAALLEWTSALDYLEETKKEFPESAAEAIQAAGSTR